MIQRSRGSNNEDQAREQIETQVKTPGHADAAGVIKTGVTRFIPVFQLQLDGRVANLPMQSNGLDASYALLSDVSARNRALQARLQSSLPLLWRDNALVLTNAAPRRRRATGISSSIAFQSQDSGEVDSMLMALEETTQASRRYRRRVEWEVARRIARVDRELQQYSPEQRFWNKQKIVKTPPFTKYRQRGHTVGRTNAKVSAADAGGSVTGTREMLRTKAEQSKIANRTVVSRTSRVKPRVAVETHREKPKVVCDVSTSPRRVDTDFFEDKENKTVNLPSRSRFEIEDQASRETSELRRPSEAEVLGKSSATGITREDDAGFEGRTDDLRHTSNLTPVQSPLVPAECSRPESASTTHELKKSDHDDELLAKDLDSPRESKPTPKERPSSSIGRQVLSEYRTMPSVASFGAQPVTSTGRPGDMRLNSDVLRRLFSDLDTDHDGHVNRIETCMALHRLQIAVPTAKIISFFRHIHSPANGKSVRSRNDQHLPMKEVINYKEFVAFVTSAYDQQQRQRDQCSRALTRRKIASGDHSMVAPAPPSMSLPICTKAARSVNTKAFAQQVPSVPIEHERRLYELNDNQVDEGIEERVIRSIPDFLVSRMLADADKAEVAIKAKEDAVNVVRKSLESLVGKEAADDKTVTQIAQELLRERLQKLNASSPDDAEDVTGLRRAAAYYSRQVPIDDAESNSIADDSNSGAFASWAEILTEEQVSGLVLQIWKDRKDAFSHAPPEPMEVASIENITGLPNEQTVELVDAATDTIELFHVPTVSEKAIQATDDIAQEGAVLTNSEVKVCEPIIKSDHPATHSPQTHLERAPMASSTTSGGDDNSQNMINTTSLIQILQQLCQQRQTHPIALEDQQPQSATTHDGNINEEAVIINAHISDEEVAHSSDDENEASEQAQSQNQDGRVNNEHSSPLPAADPAPPLMKKLLDVSKSASSGSSILELASQRSSFFSSSSSSSASDSTFNNHHAYSIRQEIGRHHLYARSTRRDRQRQYRRLPVHTSTSGSSVSDSICSAELSEGELDREDTMDLSDGEIYGACKRKYLRRKKAPSVVNRMSDSDAVHSSIESGELPALMKTHANYRQQILARSASSSVESGEVEDGALSDSESLPTRENS